MGPWWQGLGGAEPQALLLQGSVWLLDSHDGARLLLGALHLTGQLPDLLGGGVPKCDRARLQAVSEAYLSGVTRL